jgi:hypothetical protein
VAKQPVGCLATTVTLYDSLERDVRRAFPSIRQAVDKTLIRFPDAELHQEVAKTVAVLQILGNLPVTVENVASLMHPAVDAPLRMEAVKTAIDELLKDPLVPLGENDPAPLLPSIIARVGCGCGPWRTGWQRRRG